MSKSYTMDELISGYFEKQFAEADEVPLPKFSFRHRLTMKRIFKLFEHNKAMSDINAEDTCENVLGHKQLSFRKRLIIAVAIIVCLAVMTGFVIAFISGGFKGTVYQDNTHLFAIDTANCPSTIEKESNPYSVALPSHLSATCCLLCCPACHVACRNRPFYLEFSLHILPLQSQKHAGKPVQSFVYLNDPLSLQCTFAAFQ